MTKTVKIISCLLLAAILCSCSSNINIDIVKLESDICDNVEFEDKLTKIKVKNACKIYDIDQNLIEECVVYTSNAAFVDEFSIWKTNMPYDSLAVEEKVNMRIQNQKEVYATYNSKEVSKLDNAVVIQKGAYVIYCSSKDSDNARKVIEKYLK